MGDIVHIVPGSGLSISGRHILLQDRCSVSGSSGSTEVPACFIQHPDVLISGTKLVGSLYCHRRSILEQFWSGGECDSDELATHMHSSDGFESGRVMLVGSIVHQLFQKVSAVIIVCVIDIVCFVFLFCAVPGAL